MSSFNMISPHLSSVNCLQWRVQGKAAGGPPSPRLIFRPNQQPMTKLWREEPKKEKLETGHPRYLKVWIRHWFVPLEQFQ